MSMRTEILSAIKEKGEPMISAEIIAQVRERSGAHWKEASVRKALGHLVTQGKVVNLDRDSVTGYYRRLPCRYGLTS